MAGRISGITVEIGGDTTGLDKALKGVNTEIKHTQSQLKDVNQLLKLDPSNTELLTQKQRLLKDAVGSTKEKLDALKAAQEQARQQLESGEMGRDKYDALQREIISTEQELRRLEDEARAVDQSMSGFTRAAQAVGAFGETCTDAGKKLLPLTGAITGVGAVSAKLAMDFEDAMAKLSTIADETEVPIGELEKAIMSLSNQTGISATEIADNVYDAISSGQSTGDAVNFVTNSTKLAKAGFTEAGNALDILTTILNAYGLEADQVGRVSDILIKTQDLGKTTVDELSASMGKVIPTAKAYNVGLEQVATGYAIMTSNGVATAESTTYMNAMFNELGKSGTNVSNILKERTGKSFAELMAEGYSLSDALDVINQGAAEQGLAFTDMWSSAQAGRAGLILLGDSADGFNNTLLEMQQATGATDAGFAKLQTNSYTIQVVLNQLKNAATELGQAIMSILGPMLASLAEKVQALTTWFSGLSDGTKKTIVVIGGIVAAIGPVLIIIGQVASAISSIITLIGTLAPLFSTLGAAIAAANLPLTAIVAAIAAVIAIGVLLYQNWDTIKEKATEIFQAVSDWIGQKIDEIKNFFTSLWEKTKEVFQAVADWIMEKVEAIKGFFSSLWEKAKEIWDAIANVVQTAILFIGSILEAAFEIITLPYRLMWEACVAIVTAVWDAIGDKVMNAIHTIQETISTVMEVIKNVFSTMWETIKTVVQTVWDTISEKVSTAIEAVSQTISTVLTAIKEVFTAIWDSIKLVVQMVWDAISVKVSTVINAIKTTISTVMEAIKGVCTSIWEAIKNVISTVWDAISSKVSAVVNSIKNTVTNVFNAVKTVVFTIWNAVKTTISSIVDGISSKIRTVFQGVKSTVSTIFSSIKSTATSIWNGVKTAIETPINKARDIVKSALDKITSFFNGLKLNFPKIKLPHFKITGEFSLSPPSVPKLTIDWYKEGFVINKPAIFGFNGSSLMAGGEFGTGGEALLPLNSFYEKLDSILTNRLNLSSLERYLSVIADNSSKGIYLEDGTLVGHLLPEIDHGLAGYSVRNERGNR